IDQSYHRVVPSLSINGSPPSGSVLQPGANRFPGLTRPIYIEEREASSFRLFDAPPYALGVASVSGP
ncbi:hypothetical protein KI387_041811, partial [Taxus chinensis]